MKLIKVSILTILLSLVWYIQPVFANQQIIPQNEDTLWRSNEVVVRWKNSLTNLNAQSKLRRTVKKYAKSPLRDSQLSIRLNHPKRNFSVIHSETLTTKELIKQFKNLPTVEYVHENLIFHAQAQTVGWGVNNASGVKAEAAHTSGYTGASIVVAVLDTGVELTHPDLDANLWSPTSGDCFIDDALTAAACPKSGYDFYNEDNDPTDDNGHGTHVAGIIAAENNTTGVLGVAPDAKVMAVKVLDAQGAGDYATVIRGLDFAIDNGADIINMSLGAMNPGVVSKDFQDAISEAESQGIPVVIATGNVSSPAPFTPSFFENVISVGAAQETENLANPDANYSSRLSFFSNFGKVTIVAPGANIASTYLNGDYVIMDGTSMAAPHVSGVIALLKQKEATLTPAQIRFILESTAVDLGNAGKDEFFGSGLVDASAALNKTGISSTKTILLEGNWSENRSTNYNVDYYYEPFIYSTVLPADGTSTTTLRIRAAYENGAPLANESVTVSTTLGTITTATPLTTDANGMAKFDLQAPKTKGTATLTATLVSTSASDSISITFADTLVIVDAGQPTNMGNEGWFYSQALTSLGVLWKMSTAVYPTDETTLTNYQNVVWLTGRFNLSDDEQTNIKNYLDSGGRLFISGGDILYTYYYFKTYGGAPSLAVDTIFTNYLKTAYQNYIAPDYTFVGTGAFSGTGAEINDYGSVDDNFGYSDVVSVLNGGTVGGYFCANDNDASVTVSSTYRSAFLAVSLEEVSKTNREEIIQNALNFLNNETVSGGTFSIPTGCDLSDDASETAANIETSDDLPIPGLPDETPVLGDPVLVNLVVADRTDTSATIQWETSEPIVSSIGYAQNYDTQKTETMAAGDVTSVTITDLQPNTTYNFIIYGVYGDDSLTSSNSVVGMTLPAPPLKPTLVNRWQTKFEVSFTDPYETGYQFVVDLQKKNREAITSEVLEEGQNTYTFSNLSPDTTYRVLARLAYGYESDENAEAENVYSAYSEELVVKTLTDKVTKPTILKRDVDKIKISWQTLEGRIEKYVIQIFIKHGSKYELVDKIKVRKKLSQTTKKRWLENLTKDKKYRIRIRAMFKNSSKGRWSKYQSFSL